MAVTGDSDEVTSQRMSLALDPFAASASGSQLLFRRLTFNFSVPILPYCFSWDDRGSPATWLPFSTSLVTGLAGCAWPQLLPELFSHAKLF